MEILVHDLPHIPEVWRRMPDRMVLGPEQPIHRCEGCLGCWFETPGCCVIDDAYQQLAPAMSACDHLIFVSRCVYGTFSPFVKNVIDRSLGCIHPDFCVRGNRLQHRQRYPHEMRLSVYFYGDCTPEEMATARCTVTAMAVHLDLRQFGIQFVREPGAWEGIG